MHKSLSLALLIAGCGSTSPDDNSASPLYDTAVPDATPLPDASIDATITPLPYKGIVYATVEGRDTGQKYFVTYNLETDGLEEISAQGTILSVPKIELADGLPSLSPDGQYIAFGTNLDGEGYLTLFHTKTGVINSPVPQNHLAYSSWHERNLYYPHTITNERGFPETAIFELNIHDLSSPRKVVGQVGIHNTGLTVQDNRLVFSCIDSALLPQTPEEANDFEHPYHYAPIELCFTYLAQRDKAYARFTNVVEKGIVIPHQIISALPGNASNLYVGCSTQAGDGLCQVDLNGNFNQVLISSKIHNPWIIAFDQFEKVAIFSGAILWDVTQTPSPSNPVFVNTNVEASMLNGEQIRNFTPFAFRDSF